MHRALYYNNPTQIKGFFGTLWTDGEVERCGFNTVLGPNSPSCGINVNPNAEPKDLLPVNYADANKSELKATVTADGENVFDFALTD